jgi:hypothetical protein
MIQLKNNMMMMMMVVVVVLIMTLIGYSRSTHILKNFNFVPPEIIK